MRKLIALLLILGLLSSLAACQLPGKSDETLIRERIDSFLKAYNNGDMDAVLKCMDAKTRNALKGAMNFTTALGSKLTGLSGITASDLFGLGVGTTSDGDVLRIEIRRINITSSESAVVDAVMYYSDIMQSHSDSVEITMAKENWNWYIKNIEG